MTNSTKKDDDLVNAIKQFAEDLKPVTQLQGKANFKTPDFVIGEVYSFIKKREEKAAREAKSVGLSQVHEILFAYGRACEEEGVISNRAVKIRMDLSAYYHDEQLTTNRNGDETLQDKRDLLLRLKQHGHGGGNWRRLVESELAKLDEDQA